MLVGYYPGDNRVVEYIRSHCKKTRMCYIHSCFDTTRALRDLSSISGFSVSMSLSEYSLDDVEKASEKGYPIVIIRLPEWFCRKYRIGVLSVYTILLKIGGNMLIQKVVNDIIENFYAEKMGDMAYLSYWFAKNDSEYRTLLKTLFEKTGMANPIGWMNAPEKEYILSLSTEYKITLLPVTYLLPDPTILPENTALVSMKEALCNTGMNSEKARQFLIERVKHSIEGGHTHVER